MKKSEKYARWISPQNVCFLKCFARCVFSRKLCVCSPIFHQCFHWCFHCGFHSGFHSGFIGLRCRYPEEGWGTSGWVGGVGRLTHITFGSFTHLANTWERGSDFSDYWLRFHMEFRYCDVNIYFGCMQHKAVLTHPMLPQNVANSGTQPNSDTSRYVSKALWRMHEPTFHMEFVYCVGYIVVFVFSVFFHPGFAVLAGSVWSLSPRS